MIPNWSKKIRIQKLRNIVISYYFWKHKKKWNYRGVIVDLTKIHNGMHQYIINGTYESSEMNLCQKYVSPADRILEIGSAIGIVSIYCIKNIGISRITCVEPNSVTRKLLINNYELNNLSASLIAGCLTPKNGDVQLSIHDQFWSDRIVSTENSNSIKSETVRGYTLASLLEILDFTPNCLIIDIEGSEIGLNPVEIPDTIEKIIIEIHPGLCGLNVSLKHLVSFTSVGFEIRDLSNDVYYLYRESASIPDK